MIKFNKKELDILNKWVESENPHCRVMRLELPGADYSFGGTHYQVKTDLECCEWDAIIDKFRQNDFIHLKNKKGAFTNYLLTQKAVDYVQQLK